MEFPAVDGICPITTTMIHILSMGQPVQPKITAENQVMRTSTKCGVTPGEIRAGKHVMSNTAMIVCIVNVVLLFIVTQRKKCVVKHVKYGNGSLYCLLQNTVRAKSLNILFKAFRSRPLLPVWFPGKE